MEPEEIAQNVFNRIVNFCTNNYDDTVECMTNHNPDDLSVFIDSYLTDEEDEAIENSDENFWESVKKEYEKLWKEGMSSYIGSYLSDELKMLAESIIQDAELCDACKARRLKAYAEALHKFANAIQQALQNGKPLDEGELYDWFKKLGDVAFGVKNYAYYEEVDYYESPYDLLDDNEKLEVLSDLLDTTADVLYDIEQNYLPNLGVLTNNS